MLTEDWHPFRRHLAIGTDGTLTRTGEVDIFDAETGVPVETRHMSLPGEPRGSGAFMGPVAIVEFATVEFEARSTEVYGQSGDLAPIKLDSPEGMVTEGVRRVVAEGVSDTGVATLLDTEGSETHAALTRAINDGPDTFSGGDGIALEQDPVTGNVLVRVADRLKQAFLDARFALRSSLAVDGTSAPGVDASGNTVSAAAMQAVLDGHPKVGDSFGRMVQFRGVFDLGTQPLILKGHADLSNAVLKYSGAGTAVRLGNASVGQLTRLDVRIGEILYTAKPATGWTAGTVGLEVRNVFRSSIKFQHVEGFDTGLLLVGDRAYGQGGTSYNTFHMGTLNNNRDNQSLQLVNHDGGIYPFVNQNTYLGGSWAHSEGGENVRHIVIGDPAVLGAPNHNIWIGGSLEGSHEDWTLDVHGTENMWIACRWEYVPAGGTVATGAPVRWGAKALRNMILGGYMVDSILPEGVAGEAANNVIGHQSMEFATIGDGGITLSPAGNASDPMLSVMPTGWRRLKMSLKTAWMARLITSGVQFKNTTDTYVRFAVNIFDRKLTFGSGINASKVEVFWGAGTPNGVVTASIGSEYYNYSAATVGGFGKYVKVAGVGNTGWAAAGFQPFSPQYRPTPAVAGQGGSCMDTVTKRPLWSDGVAWFYADGTPVPQGA